MRKLFLTMTCLSCFYMAGSGYGQSISLSDRIDIQSRLRQQVENLINREMQRQGIPDSAESFVEVDLEFDLDKLRSDQTEFERLEQQRIEALRAEFESRQKKLYEGLSGTAESETPEAAGESAGTESVRFGMLNIDIKAPDFKKLATRPPAASGSGVALNLTAPELSQKRTFQFTPENYLKAVSVEVALPEMVPVELEKETIAKVVRLLGLDQLMGEKASEAVKVRRLKPLLVEPGSSWLAKAIDPANGFIGTVLSGGLLGLLVLVGLFLLTRVFGKLGSNILELKPAEAPSSDSSGTIDVDYSNEPTVEDVDATMSESSSYDSDATSRAMTQEMQTIRDQLAELTAENPEAVAEQLRDFFYDRSGKSKFRDLLSFAGYQAIKPSMEFLPLGLLEELRIYIEDSRDESTNMLEGVEVAQRLYQSVISQMTGPSGVADRDLLRTAMLGVSDKDLQASMENFSPSEVATMLVCTTVDRADRLIGFVPEETLKSVFEKMDEPFDQQAAQSLAKKIKEMAKDQTSTVSKQKRFILRQAKSADISEEKNIYQMFDLSNWSLRYEIMRSRFFFLDVPFVETALLKRLLESFPVSFRAEFLVVVEKELKERLLGTYESGSKARDMIDEELKQIEQDEGRKLGVLKMSDSIKSTFLEKLRGHIEKNPAIVDTVVEEICKKEGWEVPDFLRSDSDSENTAA